MLSPEYGDGALAKQLHTDSQRGWRMPTKTVTERQAYTLSLHPVSQINITVVYCTSDLLFPNYFHTSAVAPLWELTPPPLSWYHDTFAFSCACCCCAKQCNYISKSQENFQYHKINYVFNIKNYTHSIMIDIIWYYLLLPCCLLGSCCLLQIYLRTWWGQAAMKHPEQQIYNWRADFMHKLPQ